MKMSRFPSLHISLPPLTAALNRKFTTLSGNHTSCEESLCHWPPCDLFQMLKVFLEHTRYFWQNYTLNTLKDITLHVNVCDQFVCSGVFDEIRFYVFRPIKSAFQCPFYKHVMISIMIWISNYMPQKMFDKIVCQFPNGIGATFDV